MWAPDAATWAAIAGVGQVVVTIVIAAIAYHQLRDFRYQNLLWKTLEAVNRYCEEVTLTAAATKIWRAKDTGELQTNPRSVRPEVIIILNYLDGLALGLKQGLYIEDMVRDHMAELLNMYVEQHLQVEAARRAEIDLNNYRMLLALHQKWSQKVDTRFKTGRA
jgi:hypothetical protein